MEPSEANGLGVASVAVAEWDQETAHAAQDAASPAHGIGMCHHEKRFTALKKALISFEVGTVRTIGEECSNRGGEGRSVHHRTVGFALGDLTCLPRTMV